MTRFYVPTRGVESWKALLADPDRHWKAARSAYEAAHSWEAASSSPRGLPPEVARVLDTSPDTAGAELVIGLPEHRVALPGGGHASQNDLWALLRAGPSTISMAVEAKAGERLGETVGEWRSDASPRSGKPVRLAAIRELLALDGIDLDPVRYQLLHRAASALIEAERFGAARALVLVQAFGGVADAKSLADVGGFAGLYGRDFEKGRVVHLTDSTPVPLFVAWVDSPLAHSRLEAGQA
ncbi:MAG TPA: hypothetical protein VK399_08895 [Longimicrobiaceae bacterium]|nr:hypothetical protein [Longimicrobiaceae bacterium]